MGSISKKAGSLSLTVLCSALILLAGCDSPGSVGSGLTDSGAEVQVVKDTITVTEIHQFNSFSGNYRAISAGQFNDPLFGEISATSFLKPSLPSADTLFAQGGALMKLRLLYSTSMVYGDTLSSQTFDIFPITEYWRANAHKIGDNLQINENKKVASFTLGEVDSLEVILDEQWVNQHYRPYAEADSSAIDFNGSIDSTYKNQEYGLAMVPVNSNKVIPFDMSSTSFVIENAEDTLVVPPNQWAYHRSRKNQPAPPSGTATIHNMLEQVLSFSLDLEAIDVSGPNISRAELIFYQDQSALEQSLTGAEQRPQPQVAYLHYIDPAETPDNLLPGNPVSQGTFSTEDNAFHFELTQFMQRSFVNGLAEEKDFYITLPNNGSVQSSLLFADPASIHPPELIITYLKNTNS